MFFSIISSKIKIYTFQYNISIGFSEPKNHNFGSKFYTFLTGGPMVFLRQKFKQTNKHIPKQVKKAFDILKPTSLLFILKHFLGEGPLFFWSKIIPLKFTHNSKIIKGI